MMSNLPPWLPGMVVVTAWLSLGVLIGLHPRVRNMYRTRPAAPGQPTPTLLQSRRRRPDVMYTHVAGLLHYKPMMGAWLGVVSWCVLSALCAVQMPLPIAVTATPTALGLAVWGYMRPRGAVGSCLVDHHGTITLIRRDVTTPFDLHQYRYVRMYCMNYSGAARARRTPSMLVLYRDTRPSLWTWLGSVLFPRVNEERAVLLFNRWWDADGYFVAPDDLAAVFYRACARAGRTPALKHGSFGMFGAPGWEVRDEMSVF